MIAIAALRATVSPKVGPTLMLSAFDLERVRPQRRVVDRLDLGAAEPLAGKRASHRLDVGVLVQACLDPGPGLEVDAEVELVDRQRKRADGEDHPRHREEVAAHPGEVEMPASALLAGTQQPA